MRFFGFEFKMSYKKRSDRSSPPGYRYSSARLADIHNHRSQFWRLKFAGLQWARVNAAGYFVYIHKTGVH